MMLVGETPRLAIRPLVHNDAKAMEGIFCDPEVMRYSDNGVQAPEFASIWIAKMLCCYPTWGFGMWAVVEKETSKVIGYAGLSRYSGRCEPNEAEVGFRLARVHWGRGYATEAARAVCDHGLRGLLLPRIVAIVDPENLASLRVIKKIGMTFESEVTFQGYTHPDHLYAIANE
jgi:RimJ/RimL family protein N-acetyltransferase